MPNPKKQSTDKTVQLSISERLVLPSIFKPEGNFKSITIQEDLIAKTKVTQEEIKKFEINVDGKSISWNEAGVKSILKVDLTELECNEIKLGLLALDKAEKLTAQHSSLFKKFAV